MIPAARRRRGRGCFPKAPGQWRGWNGHRPALPLSTGRATRASSFPGGCSLGGITLPPRKKCGHHRFRQARRPSAFLSGAHEHRTSAMFGVMGPRQSHGERTVQDGNRRGRGISGTTTPNAAPAAGRSFQRRPERSCRPLTKHAGAGMNNRGGIENPAPQGMARLAAAGFRGRQRQAPLLLLASGFRPLTRSPCHQRGTRSGRSFSWRYRRAASWPRAARARRV